MTSSFEQEQKRKRIVVTALAALAVFDVAFWLVAVRPLTDREAEQQARIASLRTLVAQKTEALATLRNADAKAAAAADSGDALLDELTFRRRTTFSELLKELGEAAREAGVEMRETNYNSDEIEGNAEFGMVSISANFRGGYENLVKLLNRLDRSERFLIVERLGAAPREDGGLQITMRIDAFVRDAETLSADVAAGELAALEPDKAEAR